MVGKASYLDWGCAGVFSKLGKMVLLIVFHKLLSNFEALALAYCKTMEIERSLLDKLSKTAYLY